MLLCIDCGNTRIKWGLHDGRYWLAQGALDAGEIQELPRTLADYPQATRAIACNVAGENAGAAVEELAGRMGLPLTWHRSRTEQCGVINSYEDPAQLGADRWAALIGARHLHGGACLVVNAGTATTVDVLDDKGIFRGGLILAGVDLMRSALARDTAGLPLATGCFSHLPRNTADAIVSGSLLATIGAITRMFEHVAQIPGAQCLLSGGAAGLLEPLLGLPCRRVDNLVLEGLAKIFYAGGADPANQ